MSQTEEQLIQVTMTKDEFLTLEAAMGVLICVISGDMAEARFGAAMTIEANGMAPVSSLVQKALRVHTAVFPHERLNEEINATLEKLSKGGCTCGKCN